MHLMHHLVDSIGEYMVLFIQRGCMRLNGAST